MLQPLAIHSGLEAILASRSSPADIALIVLNESGALYAQAHLDAIQSNSKDHAGPSKVQQTPVKRAQNEVERQQRQRQPGLASLMSIDAGKRYKDDKSKSEDEDATKQDSLPINLTRDERARVLGGRACQAWTEEAARVRRMHATATGRFSAIASSTGPSVISGGGSSSAAGSAGGSKITPLTRFDEQAQKAASAAGDEGAATNSGSRSMQTANSTTSNGDRDGAAIAVEDEADTQEGIALPMAILGMPLQPDVEGPDVAPLLLEDELGATLVLPLLPLGALAPETQSPISPYNPSHAILLLVLSTRSNVNKSTPTQTGSALANSTLSQDEWNQMHDCAQAFASFISPALRKAFGTRGELLPDDHPGIVAPGGTTIFSDDRESLASADVSHAV
ncbi:uncharacterized protein FA14DRAFT_157609 [Meira miltonrushii]|uniref:Uncharacterized protein n=1 Tax=Meira miltonrushii TaxID=1280837 RepID=A0A316V5Q9_9BASI|nr:uncharacterized protein FA14DRAFT_157609 [Meira miltonrushii]PWN32917.1 hypothetical protein FA14DRAFT_157609 [Meira miltonrushii]